MLTRRIIPALLVVALNSVTNAQTVNTRAQNKVVDALVITVRQLSGAIGSFATQVGQRLMNLDLNNLAIPGVSPATSITRDGRTLTLSLNYGKTKAKGFSGVASVSHELLTKQGTVTFKDFSIDDNALSGTVSLEFFPSDEPANALLTRLNLSSKGVKVSGLLKALIGADGSITLNSYVKSPLTVTAGDSTFPAIVNDLRLAPIQRRSFVPEGGWIQAKDAKLSPDDSPLGAGIKVTFLKGTPDDQKVLLSVANGAPFKYTIPGGL